MYAPLQVKSAYSFLKSPNTVKQIVQVAKERGYQAVSIADNNVMYGIVDLQETASKENIKPIFSVNLQVNGLINQSTEFPILLIAKNQIGYQNIVELSSKKMSLDNDVSLNFEDLSDYTEGVACILSSQSELSQLILSQDKSIAGYLETFKSKLEFDNLYLGINPFMSDKLQNSLVDFANQNQQSLIALDEVDYLNEDDYFNAQVLQAIEQKSQIEDLLFLSREKGAKNLKTFKELQQAYQSHPALASAYRQNEILVDEINVQLNFKKPTSPIFKHESGLDSKTYLSNLAINGLKKRLLSENVDAKPYQERLQHELTVINELGFSDYFLIVYDIIRFAHGNKIQLGSGRGSAAGSLVAYTLGITNVDPIQNDLLFERFLNPERAEMPDIDIDVPDDSHYQFIDYMRNKYGYERVAQILAFQTLAAKSVLRETARVFGYDEKIQSRLSAAIGKNEANGSMTLAEAWRDSRRYLQDEIAKLSNGQLLIKTAMALEELPKNDGTHAAGIVLADHPLTETLPLQKTSKGYLQTQIDKVGVEKLGLLKIDLLSLSNLRTLADTLELAKPWLPDDFDIKKIPLNDEKTLAIFKNVQTSGIFQFDSSSARRLLYKLRPDSFELIVLSTALNRPGASSQIGEFEKRRAGGEIPKISPEVDAILADSYGIIVYQEQIMKIAVAYAGFSLSQADILRSAVSKKNRDKMENVKADFINGSLKKGHRKEEAENIFAHIERFAKFGFNKSHAVAYSQLSYQQAYLKAHYPLAFYIALLNTESSDALKLILPEIKSFGLKVLPPDVNHSQKGWSLQDDQLMTGLQNIKGINRSLIAAILEAREQNGGHFDSYPSFIKGLPKKMRSEDIISPLIYAGALDHFGYNRAELMANLKNLLEGADLGDLILSETKIIKKEEWPLLYRLEKEAQVLNFNPSGHPTEAFQSYFNQHLVQTVQEIENKENAKVIVLVNQIKILKTKAKQEEMARLTISDMTGEISATIFPRLYSQIKNQLSQGKIFEMSGRGDEWNGKLSFVINKASQLDPNQSPIALENKERAHVLAENQKQKHQMMVGSWHIKIDEQHQDSEIKRQVQQILQKNAGLYKVYWYENGAMKRQLLPEKYNLSNSPQVKTALERVLGAENVVFQQKD